ncbi:MAG TPA: histidine kinase dimerization/phospho-acceptor domain-containing protein, partial [Phenylobacterium sp.]
MTGTSADDRVGLTKTMLARRNGVKSRLAITAAYAVAFGLALGWSPAVAWFALYLALQAAEVLLFDPGRHVAWPHPKPVGWLILATNALVYGSIAILAVVNRGEMGVALAGLFLAGAVVNTLVTTQRSLGAFVASVTPFVGYLALTVWLAFYLSGSASFAAAAAIIAGMMVFTSTVIWRAVAQSQAALRTARIQADEGRAKAEALTDAKSAFVAMVSHELRTPISAILAGAEAIARDPHGPATADHAALIAQSGGMMRGLLNDLLDLSKMEAGRMSIETVAFDPRATVERAVAFWTAEAVAKGLALNLEGLDSLPARVAGDPTRLSQILNNLFSNAIKFTELGQVTLSVGCARRDGGWLLRLAISDTGPGMSPDRLAHLFTPFEQGGAATARTHGGT